MIKPRDHLNKSNQIILNYLQIIVDGTFLLHVLFWFNFFAFRQVSLEKICSIFFPGPTALSKALRLLNFEIFSMAYRHFHVWWVFCNITLHILLMPGLRSFKALFDKFSRPYAYSLPYVYSGLKSLYLKTNPAVLHWNPDMFLCLVSFAYEY